MNLLITLREILLILAFGFLWAFIREKRLNYVEALKERVGNVAYVNKFNLRENEKIKR